MLVGLVEDLLFVAPGQDFARRLLRSSLLLAAVGVQTKAVPDRLRLLAGFGHVVELDVDLELAPACLGDLEGLAWDCFDRYTALVLHLI